MFYKYFAFLCLFLAVVNVQGQDSINIEKPWARESPPGSPNGVAYFIVKGAGTPDKLVGVRISGEVASRAEFHTHKHESGVMKMEKLDAIDIPAGSQVSLEPHGKHVMLIGLERLLKAGETIVLELHFETAGSVDVIVPVLRDAP